MAEKRNIFLIGPIGAGKSTVGKQLAQQLNIDFFDSDQEIERRTGVDIGWIFDLEGEQGFRNREKKIIDELTQKQGIILATGGGCIKIPEVRKRLSARGIVVYLKTTIEKQILRTKKDKTRPLLCKKNQSIKEILEKLSQERNPLYQEIADITIHSNEYSAKIVANQIIKLLNEI